MERGVDTLSVAERLESVGVPHEQAKVQAMVLAEAFAAEARRMAELFCHSNDMAKALLSINANIDRGAAETKSLGEKLDLRIDQVGSECRAAAEQTHLKIDKMGAEVRSDLVRWVVSFGVLQMALIIALVLKLAA